MLSQLSYTPFLKKVVGLGRLELPTSRLSGVRSNHLSYKPARSYDLNIPSLSHTRKQIHGQLSRLPSSRYLYQPLLLRKEVIQPHLPIRLPCYDITPVTDLTVATCPLAVSTASSGKTNSHGETNSHGVTGGVYKARERIHRDLLIRDY